jgi:predicted O-linked N-acetylglucosamine transferase (SPINDLY family)
LRLLAKRTAMTRPGAPPLNRKQRRASERQPSFQQAVQAHQEGDLVAAERLYRRLLAIQPNDVASLSNLGLIAFGSGRFDEAERLFSRAADLMPSHARAHAGLGAVRRELGRLEPAASSLSEALRLNPQDLESLTNLGMVLLALGRADEAKGHFVEVLNADPGAIQARFHLAGILSAEGAPEESVEHLTKIVQQNPGLLAVWSDLGLAYQALGKVEEGIACLMRALEQNGTFTPALFNLASILQSRGQYADAVARYEQALAAEPGHLPARINLGLALLQLGRPEEAAARYEEVLRLSPENADALAGLADALKMMGRPDDALAMLERASRARPDSAGILKGLGEALKERRRLDQAIVRLSEAVRLDPAPMSYWALLASAKAGAADWAGLEACERATLSRIETDQSGTASPFTVLTLDSSPQEQLDAACRFAGRLARAVPTFAPRPPHGRDRIRLGYVSADFRHHATAFLATGLFEAHDRSAFEVVAYSLNPSDGSADRQRLEAAFDRFVDLTDVSHSDAARRIYDDEVDILVDLKGYTGGARAEIMAYRPAPIQVNYLGYPGTMGAGFIDYIVVDPFVVPSEMAPYYSEKLAHVPVSYQPNMRRPIAVDETTRRDHGLPEVGFVFCSFNNSYKITQPVFEVWMRLLLAAPGSVLWLLDWNEVATANLKREAASRGVDPGRLIFAPALTSAQHLARHRHADLFLDTLPVCAHTTASDALWAGLPLVCCVGKSFVSRVSGSLLSAIGLPELMTETLADYEALALRLALDPGELGDIRARLWEARTTSGLFDEAIIARRLENAYAQMWRRHRGGEAPAALSVSQ